MRDYRDAKAMAQTLRQALKERSVALTHSESLELIAKVLGLADWNTLSARIDAAPKAVPAITPTVRKPVLPMRDLVLFPDMTAPTYAGRLKSPAALEPPQRGHQEVADLRGAPEIAGGDRASDGCRQGVLLRDAAAGG